MFSFQTKRGLFQNGKSRVLQIGSLTFTISATYWLLNYNLFGNSNSVTLCRHVQSIF
jgi:hypothetical protein